MSDPTVSTWIGFFKDAGIPSGLDMKYAILFCDHRIQKEILGDLNREYLLEMGIKAMGDVIAILKQAKLVSDEVTREKTTNLIRPTNGHRSNHMDTDTSKSVFQRLGEDAPTPEDSAGVFRRLGEPVVSTTDDTTEEKLRSIKKTVNDTQKLKTGKRKSVLDRLGPPSDEAPVKKMVKTAGKNQPNIVVTSSNSVKKKVRVQRVSDVTSSEDSVRMKPKTVVRMKPLPKSVSTMKQKVIMKRVTNQPAIKRKSNVMDRLGGKVSSTMVKPGVKSLTKSNLRMRMDRMERSKVATKSMKQLPRLRSDMMRIKQPTRFSKPISSNTVSSTTSAGIFRGKGAVSHSVFDRLGK
uniref:uncharacterized protein LOC100186081 isoform X2 n=1 Tax=Ciona intestinalis TaxID=7719 RepID=UPI000180BCB4|nr:uncharacterized protein LOC100186081 isoform X2 [Ciona intestinalis]|eukprot:XP_002124334.1 uncharacterized protein LOC100186081 isoform X2 [Ciona intestinalis]